MPMETQADAALLEKLARDPHRPRYHFLPPANWMNDPNGLLQWKGQYHLFYQHNPFGPQWGNMHWGHAVSDDLVYWRHLPIALAPTPDGPDKDGVFSGSAVDNDGVPTVLYTGVRPEVQCLATSRDDLLSWAKHPGNPVIPAPPPGLDVTGFRDPCAWREGDGWCMAVGSGLRDRGGAALLYASRGPGLADWEYLHPLCVGDKAATGEMWECPDFFPLGDAHVLLVSVLGTTLYFSGTYADLSFAPAVPGNTDFGGHFYAAKTLLDDRGRRILWGWMWEGRSGEAQVETGWAGVQSLPRILELGSDGRLRYESVPELRSLRGDGWSERDLSLQPGALLQIGAEGDCLEVEAEVDPGTADQVSLALRRSPDGTEQTLVIYDRSTGHLAVDRQRSSLSPQTDRDVRGGELSLGPGEPLRLHVYLDRSVLEVFANGRACLTSRIYPSRPDSLGVALLATGGAACVTSLDVWRIAPIW